jgi:hypothetical protein
MLEIFISKGLPMDKQAWLGLAALVAIIGGGYWFTQNGPIRATEKNIYGPQCTKWISEKFNSGRQSAVYDSWKKNGKLVFQIATANAEDNRASLQLCVIDLSKGTMEKPSIFDRSWN